MAQEQAGTVSSAPTPTLSDAIDAWLRQNSSMTIHVGDTLEFMWRTFGSGAYIPAGQNLLAVTLQTVLQVSIPPASLTPSMTFSQLALLVGVA
jgi:hypothetical protein